MPQDNPFSDPKRGHEEDYFRRKDRELIDRMRAAASTERARQDLSEKTGLGDPQLLQELEALGFTPDTVSLLPLVPVIEIAWAEGGVTPAERTMLIDLARKRGIAEQSEPDRMLSAWLARRPDASVFARARRLIAAMLDAAPESRDFTADDLVKYAESIAGASGGIFGIGRISSEERALLSSLVAELKTRHS